MDFLFEILAIIFLILLALVLGFLFIPFDIVFDASRYPTTTSASIRIRWLGLPLLRRSLIPQKQQPAGEKKAKERGEPFAFDQFLRTLSTFRDLLPTFEMIFQHALRAVTFRKLKADVTFGLGDPADTAVLMGYIWSSKIFLDRLPRVSLRLSPDLLQSRLDGSINAEARVRSFPLLAGFLRAYTRKSFRKFIREVRK
jgi:hypothetical protein